MRAKTVVSLTSSALLGAAFMGVFMWAYTDRTPTKQSNTPVNSAKGQEGHFEQYFYRFRDEDGEQKVAQFEPTLPSDDAVVLPVLKSLIRDTYGLPVEDAVVPNVETRDDVNFIVVPVNAGHVVLELFRNTKGEVGTVRYWREQTR